MSLLIKPVSAFLEMKVQDRIGHESFGNYFALFSFTFFFVMLNDMGANQFLTKSVAGSSENQKHLFSNLFFYKLISIIAFPMLMVIVALFIYPEFLLEMFLIAITFSLIEMLSFFRGTFQGNQLFRYDSMMANAEKGVLIFFLSALLLTTINLELFLIARFASVATACLIALGLLWKQQLVYKPKFDKQSLKKIIRQSFPFAFMAILYTLHERVDAVMLEKLVGSHETGIYAAAYRWLDLFMMYLWTILPFFFAKFAHHEMSKVDKQQLLQAGVGFTAIPLIIVFSFALFYSPVFFEWVMKNSSSEEIDHMSGTLKILFFTLVAQGMFAILSTYLTSNGYLKFVNTIIIISIGINIILNVIFIPIYGTFAAAWTTFASTVFGSLGNIFFIQRKQIIPLPYVYWLKLGMILCLNILLYYFLNNYWHWAICFAVSSFIILIASFILNLLDIRTIRHL